MKRYYKCLPQNIINKDRYLLRTIQDSDIEKIRCWRNAQMDVLRQSTIISPEQQKMYYNNNIWPSMNNLYPHTILLGYLENGTLIGYGGLVNIAWEHRRAEISFLLNPILTAKKKNYEKYFSIFLELI